VTRAGPGAWVVGAAAWTPFGDLAATNQARDVPPGPRLALEDDGAEEDPAERILGFQGRLLAHVARVAHEEARLRDVPREEVGFFVATGMVDSTPADLVPAVRASAAADGSLDLAAFFASGFRAIHPLWPLSMLNNVAVGQVATELDVRGDNLVLSSEADAGGRAFEEALAALEDGAVRAAIVAGVSERAGPASSARALLAGAPLPRAEAAAAVVLEWEPSARARGRTARGRVARAASAFGPGGRGRVRALLGGAPDADDLGLLGRMGDPGPAGASLLVALLCERGLPAPAVVWAEGPGGGVAGVRVEPAAG
jgi:hypothetical protein